MKKQVLTLIATMSFLGLFAAKSFSIKNINYWVGNGTDTTLLVVDFKDGKAAVAFGYLFNGSTTGTDLLMAVQKEYPNFKVITGSGFLNDIYYFDQKGEAGKPNWFSTFTKVKGGSWEDNIGLGTSLKNGDWFACAYNPYPTTDKFPSIVIQHKKPIFNQTPGILATDSKIKNWATGITLTRGYQDITDKTAGFVDYGKDTSALGKVSDTSAVVSLGDAGTAILTFKNPIIDGDGVDFAIFENSFAETFLELAFVEVSSDGVNFFRFPAISLTPTETQIGGFGETDPNNIHNLAGKFKKTIGTPFDLADLKNTQGLDIQNITHVKIIDVIGINDAKLGSIDNKGNVINEPYPTAFASGGFDLDGVAVLNEKIISEITAQKENTIIAVYPTIANDFITISAPITSQIVIYNANGSVVSQIENTKFETTISVEDFTKGLYIVSIITNDGIFSEKIIVE